MLTWGWRHGIPASNGVDLCGGRFSVTKGRGYTPMCFTRTIREEVACIGCEGYRSRKDYCSREAVHAPSTGSTRGRGCRGSVSGRFLSVCSTFLRLSDPSVLLGWGSARASGGSWSSATTTGTSQHCVEPVSTRPAGTALCATDPPLVLTHIPLLKVPALGPSTSTATCNRAAGPTGRHEGAMVAEDQEPRLQPRPASRAAELRTAAAWDSPSSSPPAGPLPTPSSFA